MNSREEKRLEKTNVYNKMIKERRSRHIVWKHAFSIIQRFLRIPREYIYSIKKKWVRNHKERAHTTNLQTTRFNAYTRDVCERGSYKEWTNERDEARQTSQSNVYELTEMSIKINGVRNRSFSEYKERSVGSFFVKLMFIRCWKGIISSNNNNNVLGERKKSMHTEIRWHNGRWSRDLIFFPSHSTLNASRMDGRIWTTASKNKKKHPQR